MFNETNENDIHDEEERAIYRKMPQFLKTAIAGTHDAKEV